MNPTHLYLTLRRPAHALASAKHKSVCPFDTASRLLFYGLAVAVAVVMVWLVL